MLYFFQTENSLLRMMELFVTVSSFRKRQSNKNTEEDVANLVFSSILFARERSKLEPLMNG